MSRENKKHDTQEQQSVPTTTQTPETALQTLDTAKAIASWFGALSFSLPDRAMTASETNKGALGPARLAAHVSIPLTGTPIVLKRPIWLEDVANMAEGKVETQMSFSLTGRKSDIGYDKNDDDAKAEIARLVDTIHAEFHPWFKVASQRKTDAPAAMTNKPRLVVDGRPMTADELKRLRG